jgi:hypothetical protein
MERRDGADAVGLRLHGEAALGLHGFQFRQVGEWAIGQRLIG